MLGTGAVADGGAVAAVGVGVGVGALSVGVGVEVGGLGVLLAEGVGSPDCEPVKEVGVDRGAGGSGPGPAGAFEQPLLASNWTATSATAAVVRKRRISRNVSPFGARPAPRPAAALPVAVSRFACAG